MHHIEGGVYQGFSPSLISLEFFKIGVTIPVSKNSGYSTFFAKRIRYWRHRMRGFIL